jgi:hypothetical protein
MGLTRRRFGWACPSASHLNGLMFAVFLVYQANTEAAAGRGENETYCTGVLPLPAWCHEVRSPVRLLADLVRF